MAKYYLDVVLTNNFIYTLYSGIDDVGFYNIFKRKDKPIIKIFDWNYNLVFVLELDKFIYNFSVDEDTFSLFGIDIIGRKTYKYKINELFKEKL